MLTKPAIDVVVAIISNRDNQILVAQRAAHKHQGGLWEFPGGKVENNETLAAALRRELNEELGISIERAKPIMQYPYTYTDTVINLHVWRVAAFSGEAYGREGQAIQWLSLAQLAHIPFPEANQIILQQLLSQD